MKARPHICTAWIAMLVFCTAAGQQPQPSKPAPLMANGATISEVKGKVAVYSAQGTELAAQRGQVLLPDCRLETENGSILLALQDGSQVLVKSHSSVVVKDPNLDKGYYLELLIGRIVSKIQKRVGTNPSFRMGTPTAVITVRGTRFEVEVTKKLRTHVVVYEGLVEVGGLIPGVPPILIRPGFSTDVEHDRSPDQPREIGDFGERSGSESGREGEGGRQPSGSENEAQRPGQRPGQENSPNQSKPDN